MEATGTAVRQTMLVIVRHSPTGETAEGVALCKEIRAKLAGVSAPLILVHDATEMSLASAGYASAFRDLDKEIAKQVVQVVCAIPKAIPRMMAYTVAAVSSRDWQIFKSTDEVVAHLTAAGFSITPQALGTAERVTVRR